MLRPAIFLVTLALLAGCAEEPSVPGPDTQPEDTEPESAEPESAEPESAEPELGAPAPEPAFRVERDFEPFVFPDNCFAAHAATADEALAECRRLRARGDVLERAHCICTRERLVEVSPHDPVAFYVGCCWASGDTPEAAYEGCRQRVEAGWCEPTEDLPPEDPAVVFAATGPYERRAEARIYESLDVHRYLVPARVRDGGGMWIGPNGEPPCFVEGTSVELAGGVRPIEEVRVGDRVVTLRDGERTTAPVLGVKARSAGPLLVVDLGDRDLRVTPEHPLFVGGAWRPARDLRPGDRLQGLDEPVTVRSIAVEEGPRRVLTLRVGAPHTFFAGGVLVHNY